MFISKIESANRSKGIAPYKMDDYAFLTKLNKNLSDLEIELLDRDYISEKPNIFILGLPRSGTTLLSQVIFNHLDVGCTNNLIARFWDTPLIGTRLSRIVLGDSRSGQYNNLYANTEHITDPHEMAYFWRKHFMSYNVTESFPPERINQVDWEHLRAIIYNMNRLWEKSMVFKPLEIAGYYLEKFMEVFPRSVFIHIQRETFDTAISIAKARLSLYNDLNSWFGTYPLEYEQLKDEPWWNQIAGQMFYLNQMYNSNITKSDAVRVIKVRYEEFCINPDKILKEIIRKISVKYSYKLNLLCIPQSLKVSKPVLDDAIITKLKKGLCKYNLI